MIVECKRGIKREIFNETCPVDTIIAYHPKNPLLCFSDECEKCSEYDTIESQLCFNDDGSPIMNEAGTGIKRLEYKCCKLTEVE